MVTRSWGKRSVKSLIGPKSWREKWRDTLPDASSPRGVGASFCNIVASNLTEKPSGSCSCLYGRWLLKDLLRIKSKGKNKGKGIQRNKRFSKKRGRTSGLVTLRWRDDPNAQGSQIGRWLVRLVYTCTVAACIHVRPGYTFKYTMFWEHHFWYIFFLFPFFPILITQMKAPRLVFSCWANPFKTCSMNYYYYYYWRYILKGLPMNDWMYWDWQR